MESLLCDGVGIDGGAAEFPRSKFCGDCSVLKLSCCAGCGGEGIAAHQLLCLILH